MSREQARAEAAFVRGETGVDGQAAEQDQRDASETERDKAREQLLRGGTWLGRELLTWLLFRSEAGDPLASTAEGGVVVTFNRRVVLRGIHGEVVELSAKGALAPYSVHVRRALAEGLLVHSAGVHFAVGERAWQATLDAEFLDVRSAKLPELLTEEEDDRQSERLDLAEQLSSMVDALVEAFLAERKSKAWRREVVPAMKQWMAEGTGKPDWREKAKRAAT